MLFIVDNDWVVLKVWIVMFFDSCIECVVIYVGDF